MVFSTAGHHVKAALDKHAGHGLGVLHHLLLVSLELRLQGFFEADRFSSDHVLQRAALGAREYGRVQLLLDLGVGASQDQAATWTAQGLVRGGGHDVSERHRVRVDASGDQTGYVSHINEEISADFVSDSAETWEIQDLRVGRETGHDHFWLVLNGQALDFVVVDQAVGIDTVLNGVVQLAGGGNAGAVGQVTTVGQAHAQDGVAALQQGQVHGAVGLGTGVWLNVGVIGAEQFLGTVDCQLLNHVDVLATTVVALAWVAFGVFVGQNRTLSLHHRRAGVVFRSDQLNVLFLAHGFLLHGGEEIGVVLGNSQITAEHGGPQGSGAEKEGILTQWVLDGI